MEIRTQTIRATHKQIQNPPIWRKAELMNRVSGQYPETRFQGANDQPHLDMVIEDGKIPADKTLELVSDSIRFLSNLLGWNTEIKVD